MKTFNIEDVENLIDNIKNPEQLLLEIDAVLGIYRIEELGDADKIVFISPYDSLLESYGLTPVENVNELYS